MKEKRPFSMLLFIFFLACFFSYHVYYYVQNSLKNEKINNYLVDNKIKDTIPIKKDEFFGVIEIPKIKLKQGFFSIDNDKNNVSKNIQLIKESIMPDKKGSLLVLAAHRGNSYVSYFNKLDKLSLDDEIFIYYKDTKYRYIINKIYEEKKDGTIEINRNVNENILVLTTCSKNRNNQLVINAKYMEK